MTTETRTSPAAARADGEPRAPARRPSSEDHRSRLLQGMARSVTEKGYADTTIADIVRIAGVSRRTFYEHFVSKADCLLALYSAASRRALAVLEQAIDPQQDWRGQVPAVLRAYFECLGESPLLLRTLFIEILSLGEPGLRVRRQANNEMTGFLQRRLNADRPPRAGRFDAATATALVGAVNELVLQAIEDGRTARLGELADPAARIVLALADAQPSTDAIDGIPLQEAAAPPAAALADEPAKTPVDEPAGHRAPSDGAG